MTNKRVIRLPLICIAALFFFNPNITVIDPLPDFIGYILLCAAISRLSDIHEKIGEAYNAFRKMVFIDGAKWLAVVWVFGMTVPSERNSSLLLWTFVFAVIEMIFLIPAYSKLFDGITQIGYLYPNRSVFGERKRWSYTDKIKVFTIVFIIVKSVLSVLPELADLTNASYDESMGATINLYRYIGLLRVMAFIPVFIVGLVWMFCLISYFVRIARDKEFTFALTKKYADDVLPKTGLFVRRNFSAFTLIATVALFLTVDIRIEDNNIFPDFIAAAFFIIAFAFIGKYNGQKIKNWIFPTLLFTCFSVLGSVCEYIFFSRYYYGAIIKSDEARYLYILVVALNIIKSGVFFWMLYELYRAMMKTVKLHTGYVVGMERSEDKEAKMIAEVHYDMKKEIVRALAFSALYIVSDICFDIFAPRVDFMGLINIVFAVACIGFFIKAFSSVQEAIDTKYMLE